MDKATARPWRVCRGDEIEANGEVIAACFRYGVGADSHANTALIVKAVNSHDALLSAMREAVAHIEAGHTFEASEVLEAAITLAEGE